MNITLYHFPPAADGFKISQPSVTLETYLCFAGVEYDSVTVDVYKKIKGHATTIPTICIDGRFIGDSECIIRHLESVIEKPLDRFLTEEQRVLNKVFWRLLNASCHQLSVADRWENDEVRPHIIAYIKELILPNMPRLLRPFHRLMDRGIWKGARKHYGAIAHLKPEDRLTFVRENYAALDFYLGDKPFLFGDQPSSSDAYLYSYLYFCLATDYDSPTRRIITEEHPNLVNFYDRVTELKTSHEW